MTAEQIREFEAMAARMRSAYKGEQMVIKAACRAARCGPESICDGGEAVALLLENGWTWGDVLGANS